MDSDPVESALAALEHAALCARVSEGLACLERLGPLSGERQWRRDLAVAWLMAFEGDFDRGWERASEVARAARQQGARRWEALALLVWGKLASRRRRYDEARVALGRARSLLPEDDHAWHARALRTLAILAHRSHDSEGEERLIAEAEHHIARSGDLWEHALLEAHRAATLVECGQIDACLALLPRVQAGLEEVGDEHAIALIGLTWAQAAIAQGRFPEAVGYMERALSTFEAHGNVVDAANARMGVAELARLSGDLRRAVALFELLLHDTTDNLNPVFAHANLALIDVAEGRYRAAAERATSLLEGAQQGMLVWVRATLLLLPLPDAAQRGDWPRWAAFLDGARAELGRVIAADPDEVPILIAAAEQAEGQGRLDAAVQCEALALARSRVLGDATATREAIARLQRLAELGAPVVVGPYGLDEELGTGGMGVVWLGHDLHHAGTVAIKVLRTGLLRQAPRTAAVRGLHRELRTVAGLDHPGIVEVLGYGALDEAAEVMTEGALVAGDPWLAVEYIDGGTLEPWCGALPWRQICAILLGLLDALAHAHARGVVHLDVKPANVLVRVGPEGLEPKLTDFGLAYAFGRARTVRGAIGSPTHMAPEQHSGRWRDLGPWTDLYALGCLATELVGGAPPFTSHSVPRLRTAHLVEEPPPLVPRTPVPDGFEAWRLRLLRKECLDRFQRASDAARALQALPEVADATPDPPDGRRWSCPTLVLEPLGPLDAGSPTGGPTEAPSPVPPPAVPDDPGIEPPLRQVPPALLPLLPPPLVGRGAEKQRVWDGLRAVASDGRGRVVLVDGGVDTDRDGLCAWLLSRASELGVATPLSLQASDRDALEAALGTTGLQGAGLRVHLRKRTRHLGWDADQQRELADGFIHGGPRLRAALLELVRAQAIERPVVFWIQDASAASEPAALVALLRDAGAVLVVVGVDTVGRPLDRALAASWRSITHDHLVLEKLDDPTLLALLRSASVDPRLAHQVLAHAQGSAPFAWGLVTHWQQVGCLIDGPEGLRLRNPAEAPAPEGWLELARQRARDLQRRWPEEEFAVLTLAAIIGREVPLDEWHRACAAARLLDVDAAVERASSDGLGVDAGGWWRFADAGLREALLEHARASGTWARDAAACADAVDRDDDARLGRALCVADRSEEALQPLLRATRERLARGAVVEASLLLEQWEHALSSLALAASDPRRSEGAALREQIRHLDSS